MKQPIKKIAYGSATILEAINCFAKAHSAADFMYYVCRVFGIALPLQVAIALRVLLLTTAESVTLYFMEIAGRNPRFLRKSAVCIPQFLYICIKL